MDRQTRRRAATAEEIVDSAEQLVLAADLESLTVQAIARGIGMTAGALYRYFPSRDAIVAAVQRRVIAALAADVDRAVGAVDDPDLALARVVALGHAVVDFARAEPGRYGLLARMLTVPRPLVADAEAAAVLPVALAAVARARDALGAARVAGALGPGDDGRRLLVLWAGVHGAIQLDKLRRFAPEAASDRVAADLVDDLVVGWGADRARVAGVRARRSR